MNKYLLFFMCCVPLLDTSLYAGKRSLLKRVCRHEDSSESTIDINVHQCPFCHYEFAYKSDYTRHVLGETINALYDVKYGVGKHAIITSSDVRTFDHYAKRKPRTSEKRFPKITSLDVLFTQWQEKTGYVRPQVIDPDSYLCYPCGETFATKGEYERHSVIEASQGLTSLSQPQKAHK